MRDLVGDAASAAGFDASSSTRFERQKARRSSRVDAAVTRAKRRVTADAFYIAAVAVSELRSGIGPSATWTY